MKYIPLILSITRIILALPIVLLLIAEKPIAALTLFAIAGITDALDGYLARKLNAETALGQILDPIGDRVLYGSAFITAIFLYELPLSAALLILSRDIAATVWGVIGIAFLHEKNLKRFPPLLLGRVTTFLQTLTFIVIILPFTNLTEPLIIGTIIISLTSGIEYTVRFIRSLIQKK